VRTLRAGQVLPPSWISVSHAARPAGFTPGKLDWPGTWTDRADRDRTLSVPGHELSGVVELGNGTTDLTVGQRVFGLNDRTRDGSLAEYTAVEARNLVPLTADVDHTVAEGSSGASREIAPRDSEPGAGQRGRTPMTPSPSIPRTR
jgi:hypothetical protein